MSLPILTTAGAVYRGAWRAEDAVFDGSNHVSSVPSLVGGSGATLLPRWWEPGTSTLHNNDPSENTVYNASAIDGGPAIVSLGVGGMYTEDATILSTIEGTTFWESYSRGKWNVGSAFAGMNGFEAWVQNQGAYLENGGDGSPSAYIQLDRGSSRSTRGTATGFTNATNSFNVQCNTAGDFEAYINNAGAADVTMSFFTNPAPGTFSAYMTGPLQRTASAAFPPGIWQYPGAVWTWSRLVLVSCPSGLLNSTDRENLYLWVNGENFETEGWNVLFWMCL